MRDLLDVAVGKGSTVSDLVYALRSAEPVELESGGRLLAPMTAFDHSSYEMAQEYFGFIATQPRRLVEDLGKQIAKMVADDDITFAENKECANLSMRLNAHMDKFTRQFAFSRPWETILNGGIGVIQIWRNRDDEVIGEPEYRNVPSTTIPNTLSSMVVAQRDGEPDQVLISLSSGKYRDDGNREDFLLDIPALIASGMNQDKKFHPSARINCSRETACRILSNMIHSSIDLLETTAEVAKKIAHIGRLEDPDYIFGRFESIRKGINPEDSPNALIEIGGWA